MDVPIAAVGMVSALGLDWHTSCAAGRAGISRAAPVDHYRLQAGDCLKIQFLVAHQIDLLARGFEGQGRLLRLLAGAFADLRQRIPTSPGEIPLFLALPDPDRISIPAEENSGDSNETQPRPTREEMALDLVERAAQLGRWPGRVRLASVSTGHTGFAEALHNCVSALTRHEAELALVGASDSLLDDDTLNLLKAAGRLKHPEAPTGLVPGEAAVLFQVGKTSTAERGLGSIEAICFSEEQRHLASGNTSHGKALFAAIAEAGSEGGWPGSDVPWIFADHNGEAYRANEWGFALHRLVARNRHFAETKTSFPAIFFGDTGAASAAVAVANALASWKRGYAIAPRCCVVSSADAAPRSAILLRGAA
jgi:3-oxoacyl-[acyl-carrier-protein] synthase I